MSDYQFPSVKPIRPLDKGMITHVAPQAVPEGGFVEVKNFFIEPDGLLRRGATVGVSPSSTVTYPPVQAIYSLWDTDGTQLTCVIDQKYLYTLAGGTLTPKYNLFTDAHTITIVGTAVTGDGTGWATASNMLQAGDVMVVDPLGAGDGPETVEIASIGGATSITLANTLVGTYNAGTAYEIRRAFKVTSNRNVDGTIAENKLVLADGSRFLYAYDTSGGLVTYNAAQTEKPSSVAYFHDRVWILRVEESGTEYVQRVRWSDLGIGNMDTFAAGNYQDLPYSKGQGMKVLPLHEKMVFYFEDAIYTGTPTTMPTQPLWFDRIETGGVGLAGMSAVCQVPGGHVFVGHDDIYFFDGNSPPVKIGTPIVKDSLKLCTRRDKICAGFDSTNGRVMIGFPLGGSSFERVFVFSLDAKAWSYLDVSGNALNTTAVADIETWASITIDWDEGTTTDIWSSYSSGDLGGAHAYFGQGNKIYELRDTGYLDNGTSGISAIIETPDYDLGQLDLNKIVTRFSLKLSDIVTSAVTFRVYGSINRGNTWKSLGLMTIAVGDDEGRVDFRLLGSTIRFKVEAASNVAPYTINEMSYKVRIRGLETPGRLA